MKNVLLSTLLMSLGILGISYAQTSTVSFDPSIIDDNASTADAANTVTTGDFDQDGDVDVVGGAFLSDIYSLYTNDGAGNFTQSTIDNGPNADGARFVKAYDLDDDGDLDILACSSNANLSLWYENDGSANFSANIIDNTAFSDEAYAIDAGDLDGDGDMDVVIGANGGDSAVWLANDGNENFSLGSILDNSTDLSNGVRKVSVVDLDQDGDLDVVVAAFVVGVYSWFDNDGAGNFSSRLIDDSADAFGATAFEVADLDNDGDLDLAAGSNNANQYLWYENDGDENFSAIIIDNTTDYSIGPRGLTTSDLDQDGDIDIITAAITGDAFAWYENDGSAGFEGAVVSDDPTYANGAFAVVTSDIDGDTYEDLVVAANISDAFSWFKTTVTLGIAELGEQNVSVYPVPVLDRVTVVLPKGLSNVDYSLVNTGGLVVLEGVLENSRGVIDLSPLSSGVYVLKCKTSDGIFIKRLIKR